MNTSPDFDALAAHAPIAPRVGPFAGPDFLRTLWDHRAVWPEGGNDAPSIVSDGHGAAALTAGPGRLGFLGHEDLVDYRAPVGEGAALVAQAVVDCEPGTRYRFDSLPEEAAKALAAALDVRGVTAEMTEHTIAAVLSLPETFDEYLMAIGKKERHETRRKRRRFEAAIGAPRIITYTGDGPALTRFFRMHRMAPGDKGEFMTPEMMAYFTDLAGAPGWRIDGLYGDDSRMVAAAMSWSDESGYYLYNSAFDPAPVMPHQGWCSSRCSSSRPSPRAQPCSTS